MTMVEGLLWIACCLFAGFITGVFAAVITGAFAFTEDDSDLWETQFGLTARDAAGHWRKPLDESLTHWEET